MAILDVAVGTRIRRKRLAFGAAKLAVWASPVIGRRLAIWFANAAVRLLRVDYRIGRGDWRRLDVALPQVEFRP